MRTDAPDVEAVAGGSAIATAISESIGTSLRRRRDIWKEEPTARENKVSCTRTWPVRKRQIVLEKHALSTPCAIERILSAALILEQ